MPLCLSLTFIVAGDTAGKLLTAEGVDPLFVSWSRFAIAALLMLPFSGLVRPELADFTDWRVLLRGALIAGAISCILTALKTEPMANVFGAFFVGPAVSYLLAIVFLRERPSPGRSALMALGFAGVMLVVKPGFGVTPGMGFALMAGTFHGAFLVMTRRIAGVYRPRFLLISQLLVGTVLLAPLGLTTQLPAMRVDLLTLVLISALGSAVGNYILVHANRKAEASLIAPLIYLQLISAAVLGVLVFGDWPDLLSILGLILIALSGLGTLMVQHRGGKSALADQGQKTA